jgi:hypothetical protein
MQFATLALCSRFFHKAFTRFTRVALERHMTLSTVEDLGVPVKMLETLKSMYRNIQYCVRINDFRTDWFEVNSGLKQSCVLSPLLFNLYLDDLSRCTCVQSFGKDIDIGEDT